jgi:hypothetical protein
MAREEGSDLDCLSLNLGSGSQVVTQERILLGDHSEEAKLPL